MRLGNVLLWLTSLALIGSGVAMISTVALPIFLGEGARGAGSEDDFRVPVLQESSEIATPVPASATSDTPQATAPEGAEVAPREGPGREEQERRDRRSQGPTDNTLSLTIPKMSRVEGAEIPTTAGDDTEALDDNVAIHLEGTGFPWQDGANTYIAGHRLGYPATGSFLAFYDLDKLERGDEVLVTDADGNEYRYRVYRELIVDPTDLSITQPVAGKDVLTLQTCTLPDYSQRLIVQAEKV